MKSAPKILKLIGLPKTLCQPLTFPLSQEDVNQIKLLQYSFRNTFSEYNLVSLGLAAPQIGINKRFFIMPKHFNYGEVRDFSKLKYVIRRFTVYINPQILVKSDEKMIDFEYCFSADEHEYKVQRPKFVEVKYYNQKGSEIVEKLPELRSRVFQHQLDHLNGILVHEVGERLPKKHKKVGKQLHPSL